MEQYSSVILLAAALAFAGAAVGATPQVKAVYPSSGEIPENLLRMSLVFNRPSAPDVRRRVALVGGRAQSADSPFLSPELRSPDGRTVTLLLDPARVKTGTAVNLALGRALRDGDDVTLTLDGKAIRTWQVGKPLSHGPDPARWRLKAVPRAGSATPLLMDLDHPVDDLDADLIGIAGPDGRRVQGQERLPRGEAVWAFQPSIPWKRGSYIIRVNEELEDPCGNRVGVPFETRGHATGGGAPPTFMIP